MAALTNQQRADIRYYAGWSARFHQYDSRLEMAMNAMETEAEHQAHIFNAISASPPGLVPQLQDIDAKILAAHGRLKATEVGSIKLNGAEIQQLRSLGRQLVSRLCSILGVERRNDVFSPGAPNGFAGFDGMSGGGNFVGK